jgi:hypothetical protein
LKYLEYSLRVCDQEGISFVLFQPDLERCLGGGRAGSLVHYLDRYQTWLVKQVLQLLEQQLLNLLRTLIDLESFKGLSGSSLIFNFNHHLGIPCMRLRM